MSPGVTRDEPAGSLLRPPGLLRARYEHEAGRLTPAVRAAPVPDRWHTVPCYPQARSATSPTSWSLRPWASSLIALPGPAEEKPHWVDTASCSRGK